MDLEPRLEILRQGGLLSPDNEERIRGIIAYFQNRQNIELTEDNAAAFITHMCSSLERISRDEPIQEIDPDVYQDATQEPTFEMAHRISLDIQELYPMIPDMELKFIIMHVGALLIKISDIC